MELSLSDDVSEPAFLGVDDPFGGVSDPPPRRMILTAGITPLKTAFWICCAATGQAESEVVGLDFTSALEHFYQSSDVIHSCRLAAKHPY